MTSHAKNGIYLVLLIAVGILIYYPSLDILPYISEGDTGRDLYAYEMTLEGKIPYRDFYYNYGPLMPYYYALCFKIFGIKISSVLLGRMILNILSGFLIYKCLRLFFQPVFAILGAAWFWSFKQDFTYSFNHTGGICLILLIIYCLMRRIINPTPSINHLISAALFLLFLVKINIGVATLVATGLSYMIINTHHGKGRFDLPLMALGASLLLSIFVYVLFLWGVPSYFIFQCFPFLPGYEPAHGSLMDAFKLLLEMIWSSVIGKPSLDKTSLYLNPLPFQLMWVLGVCSLINFLSSWFAKGNTEEGRPAKKAILVILIIILFVAHEFLLSAIEYRIWWGFLIGFLGVFFIGGFHVATTIPLVAHRPGGHRGYCNYV